MADGCCKRQPDLDQLVKAALADPPPALSSRFGAPTGKQTISKRDGYCKTDQGEKRMAGNINLAIGHTAEYLHDAEIIGTETSLFGLY